MVYRYLFLSLIFFIVNKINAQPFNCTGDFILAISMEGDSSDFFNVEINADQGGMIAFDKFSDASSIYLNAIGYRWTDNYVYGVAVNTRDLYRVDASGAATFIHHFDEFDNTKSYNAGDVTIDGRYLVLLSGIATNLPWRNEELVLVDLEDPDYGTTIIPLSTFSGGLIYALDIAFNPITGILYAFDGLHGRLVKIDMSTGYIDDESFENSETINLMAAMFFDSFGNLYGYAKHLGQPGIKALYQVDIITGSVIFLLEGPMASGSDGCSCPYRLELLESVETDSVASCSEVIYTFVISNASFNTQSGVQFKDDFPVEFEVLEVTGNTYGGQISGLNSSSLQINNMSITSGIDSFFVKVAVHDAPPDSYPNQASLNNLSSTLGSIELSDDPTTLPFDDPTNIEVIEIETEGLLNQTLGLCPDDTLLLDATLPAGLFSYLWDDGSNDPILEISEPGIYEAVATNACETFNFIFTVEAISEGFDVDLGADQNLVLGDLLFLNPEITASGNLVFEWIENPGLSIECFDCLNQSLVPFENTIYTLLVTDENNCIQEDQINVLVNLDYQVFAPNIFSPNGDDINDLFFINGKQGTLINYLRVFNRWGGLLYEEKGIEVNDDSNAWDGTIKGKIAEPGVYVWTALIRFVDGEEKVLSGSVTLVR